MRAISSLLLFYPFLITTFFSFFKQARKNEGACRSYVKKTTCFQTFRVIYKKTPIMDLQENTYNGDFLKQSCRPTSFKFVKKKTPRLCKICKYNFLQNITVRLVLCVGYADCVSVFFLFRDWNDFILTVLSYFKGTMIYFSRLSLFSHTLFLVLAIKRNSNKTAEKMMLSINDFFSKYDQIHSFLRI